MKIKISAVVCTHNRCESLRETIESLQCQIVPRSDYEIVVVDNRSTDATRRVVDECSKESSVAIRYVFEPQLGLSHARNAGIQAAEGEVVAFIDDDAVADREWLSQLLRTHAVHPDAACVGGRVLLAWKSPRPDWWEDNLNGFLSAADFGDVERTLAFPQCPNGTNISFKRNVFSDHGLFDVRLGRKGRKLLGYEENELCLRISQSGGTVYYAPSAVVYHATHEDRLTRTYLARKAYWDGRLACLVVRENTFQPSEQFGLRRMFDDLRDLINLRWSNLSLWCSVCFNLGYFAQQCIMRVKGR